MTPTQKMIDEAAEILKRELESPEMAKAVHGNHGGTRKGAGRPKSNDPAKHIQITMAPNIFDTLERLRGATPRSKYLRLLVINEDNRQLRSKPHVE